MCQGGRVGAAGAGEQVGGRAVSLVEHKPCHWWPVPHGQHRQDSLNDLSASSLRAPGAGAPHAAGSVPAIPLLCAVLLLLGLSFYSLCSSWVIVKTKLQFDFLYSLGS